ncbi:expressed unknown protein [Seminavis robusta]|uniref:Uncharacterized protein n=1 Tax=Seminavis robusta TaxID=568900 RepID=A0A9N8HMP1_9STRA|nr:expressed unknown protein [Seminavis robusta]|eukprot:Sro1136_g245190.1 n/a (263) ;mRNA; r:21335-22123
MVSYAVVVATLAALTTSMFQMFKPRLPPYSLQIVKVPVPSVINGEIFTMLTVKVRLHNSNFIAIDVHSLAFDLFYPDYYGALTHIGRVYDHNIQHRNEECLSDDLCRRDKGLDKAVWALQARGDFDVSDKVFASLGARGLLRTLPSLVWNSFQGGGSLVIPTTGVMQVKASSSTPVTMSMICDNSLNLWTLVLVGVECTLNSIDIGWIGLDATADKLQAEVLSTLKANATGGVLEANRPRIEKKKRGLENMVKKLNSGAVQT